MPVEDEQPPAAAPVAIPAYSATSIRVLKGVEAVRVRPGMYIGSTDQRGLHHLVYEIVDNSVEEALAGEANHIDVTIRADGAVMVRDNGRGISVDVDPSDGKSGLEVVMTTLGLHRIGATVVNALSSWARAEVRRNGKIYAQNYAQGVACGPVEIIGTDPTGRGTTTYFQADPTIFQTIDYDYEILAVRFREICYLIRSLMISFVDQRAGRERESSIHYEEGIRAWVCELNRDHNVLHPLFYVGRTVEQTEIEVALQYNDTSAEWVESFANQIKTVEGSTHMIGFRSALTDTLNNYARKNGLLKKAEASLARQDTRSGLTAIIRVNMPDPYFVGCLKGSLGNPEARDQVQYVVTEALEQFLAAHPAEARRIIEHCRAAAQARAMRKLKRIRSRRDATLDA